MCILYAISGDLVPCHFSTLLHYRARAGDANSRLLFLGLFCNAHRTLLDHFSHVIINFRVSTVCHYVWCCEPVLKLELERVGPTSLFLSFGCQLLPMFTGTQPINILR